MIPVLLLTLDLSTPIARIICHYIDIRLLFEETEQTNKASHDFAQHSIKFKVKDYRAQRIVGDQSLERHSGLLFETALGDRTRGAKSGTQGRHSHKEHGGKK